MRLILFLAVLALGADALYYNGAYTQAAYQEISTRVDAVISDARNGEPTQSAEREAPASRN
jgi:hypothetical protein